MKKLVITSTLFYIIFTLIGCASSDKKIIPEGPDDHEHIRPNMKVIGDYHAQLVVEHGKGKIELNIYNDVEDPSKIKADKLIATLRLVDGTEQEIILEPQTKLNMSPEYRTRQKRYGISSSYSAWVEEIKNFHEFDIKFIIPIESETYEVNFHYSKDKKENAHHMHQ